MHKHNRSCTAFAFIAGATVAAAVALLFTPQAGGRLRSSLREYTRRPKSQVDQGTEPDISTAMQADAERIRNSGAECSVRSLQQDHTEGDTGHDN